MLDSAIWRLSLKKYKFCKKRDCRSFPFRGLDALKMVIIIWEKGQGRLEERERVLAHGSAIEIHSLCPTPHSCLSPPCPKILTTPFLLVTCPCHWLTRGTTLQAPCQCEAVKGDNCEDFTYLSVKSVKLLPLSKGTSGWSGSSIMFVPLLVHLQIWNAHSTVVKSS